MQIKNRCEIEDKYKWDLGKIYKNEDEISKDIEEVKIKTNEFIQFQGKLTENANNLLSAIELQFSIIRILDKLIVYSNMKYHEDQACSKSKTLMGKIDKLSNEIFEKLAFFTPELLESDYDKILGFIKEEKNLKTYEHVLEDVFREKEHSLSIKEEEMLARLGEVLAGYEDVYTSLDDVDLSFGKITDEEENEVEINGSNFTKYIKSNDRRVRKDTFYTFYNAYKGMQNTFSSTLKGSVDVDTFVSNTRKYESVLQMSLYSDNIDTKLYDKLINKVNDSLDILHKYIKLRKDVLKLDDMHMYDIYAPLVKNIDKNYTYEEAKEIVINALQPLGDTYINDLTKLFESKIIDVYNNKNKHGGAYSWGCYDSMPYVLLNYEGTYNDVSTIAHELGHSMHSYYSHKNQEYHNSSYTIFLAEIASTVNEILLNRYSYENAKTKEEKLYYLNNLLESFRTTLYRQTMFAEFEKIIHDEVQNGGILTSEYLSNTYLELNKKYYGNDIISDEEISYEWMRISHFYNSFYVYKYATGIAIASSIASDILNKKDNALENYIEFLSSGGKDYSLNILKNVGIDIVNDDTIDKAIKMFEDTINEFINVLNS